MAYSAIALKNYKKIYGGDLNSDETNKDSGMLSIMTHKTKSNAFLALHLENLLLHFS